MCVACGLHVFHINLQCTVWRVMSSSCYSPSYRDRNSNTHAYVRITVVWCVHCVTSTSSVWL